MRLLRFGDKGQEKPGILAADGSIRDLSGTVEDFDPEWLGSGGIFFDPRSTFDLVMAGQMSIFGEIDVFSTLQDTSDGAMADITMKPSPSCSVDNWHHFYVQFIAFVRFLSLHNPRKSARSRPPRSVGDGRPAASDFGSSLLLALP